MGGFKNVFYINQLQDVQPLFGLIVSPGTGFGNRTTGLGRTGVAAIGFCRFTQISSNDSFHLITVAQAPLVSLMFQAQSCRGTIEYKILVSMEGTPAVFRKYGQPPLG